MADRARGRAHRGRDRLEIQHLARALLSAVGVHLTYIDSDARSVEITDGLHG
jgi:hypothetical protein